MDAFDQLAAQLQSQGQIGLKEFLQSLAVATAMAALLGVVFVKYGRSLSNRKLFAAGFIPVTLITMFIIAVVKSSLALSLGLVGALSIVRFRTAIREPEELIYLFLCIALGLGFGAGQWVLTIAAFTVITLALVLVGGWTNRDGSQLSAANAGVMLTVQKVAPNHAHSPESSQYFAWDDLGKRLQPLARRLQMRRVDAGPATVEATFALDGLRAGAVGEIFKICRDFDPDLRIMILDRSSRAGD